MYNFLSDGAEYLAPKAAAAGKVNLEQIVIIAMFKTMESF